MANDFISKMDRDEIRKWASQTVRNLGEIDISASGTKIAHGMKGVPRWVQCIPKSSVTWWYYQNPDATYIYIQASAAGRFLVTVGG